VRGDTVSLDLGSAAACEAALGRVRGLDGVLDAGVYGGRLRVLVGDGAQALPKLVFALGEAGIAVRAATMARPSLDEVYLHYTGKEFAAADAPETKEVRP
jgi:ABC-2 type transport system ATP-binding protein